MQGPKREAQIFKNRQGIPDELLDYPVMNEICNNQANLVRGRKMLAVIRKAQFMSD